MAITSDEIMAEIENHRDELVAHMVEETKQSISNQISWSLRDEISKLVKNFIADEMAPQIKSALTESKPAILLAVTKMSEELSEELAKAMLAEAKENLQQSYKRAEILKKLFD